MRALFGIVLAIGVLSARPAHAQPGLDVATLLRDANSFAGLGDWQHVDGIVGPLLLQRLARADVAEVHRLAGLSAFFMQHRSQAEAHFLAYLELDTDARLDPSVVPPEAVTFFEDVRARHAAEIRAHRPKPRNLFHALLPPWGQFDDGEPVKGWIVLGTFGAFLATDLTSFFVLRSWCSQTDNTCDATSNHTRAARTLRTVNLISGAGAIVTYLYGVYDGVVGYRRAKREELVPYVSGIAGGGGVVGVGGAF